MGRFVGVLGLVCAVTAGCAATPAASVRPSPRPGATAFRLDQRLGWPYELTELALFVDGRPMASRSDPASGTMWLGQTSLAPGRHVFVLRAVVGFASDMVGGRCTVQLRSMRVFQVGEQSATIRLTLYERDVTYDFVDRVDATVRMEGATVIPIASLRRARQAEQSCGARERAAELLCRAESREAEARRGRDGVGEACLASKIHNLKSLADVRRRWLDHQRRDPSADSPAGSPAAMVLLAERRMETLWQEIEACAPHHGLELQRSSRAAVGAGCESYSLPAPFEADAP